MWNARAKCTRAYSTCRKYALTRCARAYHESCKRKEKEQQQQQGWTLQPTQWQKRLTFSVLRLSFRFQMQIEMMWISLAFVLLWQEIGIKVELFVCFAGSTSEERRFQEPHISVAPLSMSSSPPTTYVDQRRSPSSVTVQMEEKYLPPSASSLYESRFRGRQVRFGHFGKLFMLYDRWPSH